MMKVLINRNVVQGPWGGGNAFVRAFRDNIPMHSHVIVESLNDAPDVVLLMGPGADDMGIDAYRALDHKRRHPHCNVVMRLNDCDARKGTRDVDSTLWNTARDCDNLVFVSRWLQEHLLERWLELQFGSRFAMQFTRGSDKIEHFIQTAVVIHNGVDKSLFKPQRVELRDREKIVAHHWSDNPLKGRDVYEALDSITFGVEFTYIGRHQCSFKNPRTRVVPPCYGHELASTLGANSVYVTGTRFDPGPNHVLEALACDLPVWVHRDGGGAVEFAGEDHTFDDVEQLKSMFGMGSALTDRGRRIHTPNTYKPMTWESCIAQYVEVFERIHSHASIR